MLYPLPKQYQNQGLSLPDLINEGNLGLIKAAQRFDETRGFKFISYAVWWIRQSILQALAEQSRIVRLPLNKVGLTNRIQKAFSQLEQEFEREPSPEELAELLELEQRKFSNPGNCCTPCQHGYSFIRRRRQYPDGCDGKSKCGKGRNNIEHNES